MEEAYRLADSGASNQSLKADEVEDMADILLMSLPGWYQWTVD